MTCGEPAAALLRRRVEAVSVMAARVARAPVTLLGVDGLLHDQALASLCAWCVDPCDATRARVQDAAEWAYVAEGRHASDPSTSVVLRALWLACNAALREQDDDDFAPAVAAQRWHLSRAGVDDTDRATFQDIEEQVARSRRSASEVLARWRASGLVEDEVAWLHERVRAGDLRVDALRLAAHLGHAASAKLVGSPTPCASPRRWADHVGVGGVEACIRAAVAAARAVARDHAAIATADAWLDRPEDERVQAELRARWHELDAGTCAREALRWCWATLDDVTGPIGPAADIESPDAADRAAARVDELFAMSERLGGGRDPAETSRARARARELVAETQREFAPLQRGVVDQQPFSRSAHAAAMNAVELASRLVPFERLQVAVRDEVVPWALR
jgi:hypothetical protein